MASAAGRTRGLRGLYLDGELRGYCGLYPRRSFTADCIADREHGGAGVDSLLLQFETQTMTTCNTTRLQRVVPSGMAAHSPRAQILVAVQDALPRCSAAHRPVNTTL
jgi:hypothetical protein